MIIALVLPFCGASAQEEESAELTVSDIVDKAFTAYGGKEALEQIDYLSVVNGKQIATTGARTELGYRCARKNGKWRIDLERLPEKTEEQRHRRVAKIGRRKKSGRRTKRRRRSAKLLRQKKQLRNLRETKAAQPSEVIGF